MLYFCLYIKKLEVLYFWRLESIHSLDSGLLLTDIVKIHIDGSNSENLDIVYVYNLLFITFSWFLYLKYNISGYLGVEKGEVILLAMYEGNYFLEVHTKRMFANN